MCIEKNYRYKFKVSSEMTIALNFVTMRSNYHELENLVDFTREYEFDMVMISSIDGNPKENIFISKEEDILKY